MRFGFELTYQQEWENVSSVRHFISEMLSREFGGIVESKKISTATSELMENVVKYSTVSIANLSIKCDKDNSVIYLIATNAVSKGLLAKFESIFDEVHQGEPKEVYKEMMLRSLCETEVSQLGLARIRYECNGDISYEVSEYLDGSSEFRELPNTSDDRLLTITVKIPILEHNQGTSCDKGEK